MSMDRASLESYTIAWVAPLSVERAAGEAMLDEEHEEPDDFEQHPSDNNEYSWGRMGAHNVVIAALPSGTYGTTSAAVLVSQLASSLPHIKIGVLVGIAGAIPNIIKAKDATGTEIEHVNESLDVRLGDVVVGRPDGTSGGVVQYDLGKSKAGQVWERKGSLNAPPTVLLSALAKLESAHKRGKFKMPEFLAHMWETNPYMTTSHGPKEPSYTHQGFETDRLFKAEYNHPDGETDCNLCEPQEQVIRRERVTTNPEIHYGVIASGNTLMKDAATRDRIAQSTGEKCICYEMEAAGVVSHFPCLVIRGICDYSDSHKNDRWQPYASATAAAYAKELLSHLSAKKLAVTESIKEIKGLLKSVDQLQVLTQETNTKVDGLRDATDNAARQNLLSKLPVSDEARYNSYTEGSSPICLQDTRVEVLSDIFHWLEGDGAPVFWLSGRPGTGKSTIARTVAKTLDERHQLGASFFFKRGEADRNNIRKLSSTIAADLAVRYPTTTAHILESLADDPVICTKAAHEQFRCLVLKPVSLIQKHHPIIIVIDALDECDDADLETFFGLVSDFKSANLPNIKLFLTGRPDRPIIRGFGNSKEYYENIILHNIETPTIEHDILIFLKHELRGIRDNYNNQIDSISRVDQDWPMEEDIQKLLKMANKVFIFAATICKLLSEGAEGSPASQLRDILTFTTQTGHAFESTYLPVLNRQFPKSISKIQKQTIIDQIKLILGAIAVLTDPLSLPALARLIDLDIKTIQHRLNSLQSVVEVVFFADPENLDATHIRFHHLSFREYLQSSEIREVSHIWVDEHDAHSKISSNCLRVLNKSIGGLRMDICSLKVPGTPRSSVTKDHINECMASELQYACTNLPQHLKSALYVLIDDDALHQFLLRHFLHWLEALSLLGLAFEALRIFKIFRELIHPRNTDTVRKFLDDGIRFIEANMDTLDRTPLQIYSSALIFAPRNSIIRNIFEQRYTSWIKRVPAAVQENWSIEVQHLRAHDTTVDDIFFSPDGSLIASISLDEVQVSSITGKRLLTFRGTVEDRDYNGAFLVVAFSPDSRFITMGDDTNKIQVWDIVMSKCIHVLETNHQGPRRTIYGRPTTHSISFTDGCSCILTTSPSCAEIWSLKTGVIVRSISYPLEASGSDISPCNSIIAAYFKDCIILWNINSCEQIRRIEHEYDWDGYIEFISSQNLDIRILTVRYSESRLQKSYYSPLSGEPFFSEYSFEFADAVFNDKLIVVMDGTIQIYNTETGEPNQTLPAPRHADTMAYSPKSSLLAAAAFFESEPDGVIFLWRLEVDKMEVTGGDSDMDGVIATAQEIRYDLRHFTSPSCGLLGHADEHNIHLWRAYGEPENVRIFQAETIDFVTLSTNDRFLVTASNSTATIWELESAPVITSHFKFQLIDNQTLRLIFLSPDSTILGLVIETYPTEQAFNGRRYTPFIRLFSIETGKKLSEISMAGKLNFGTRAVCISSDHLLLAMSGYDEAIVWEIAPEDATLQEIFATSESTRALFKETTESTADGYIVSASAKFSPDASLLLFIRCGILEIWHLRQRVCLQRILHGRISRANILSEEPIIITDVGSMSYHFSQRLTAESCDDSVAADKMALGDVNPSLPFKMSYNWVGWGLSHDRCWITWNNENWLWLPLDSRRSHTAISNCSILLADESIGGEMWFEFVDNPILDDRSGNTNIHLI